MNKKPFWEDAYKAQGPGNTFAAGKPSLEFYELITQLRKGARVLDLGCGDGRNAMFLAEHGFDVTAVDISENAIDKVRVLATQKGVEVNAQVQDMREYMFTCFYDLIISHGNLHLIEREDWTSLIEKIKNNTISGGYNVIAVFTDSIPPPADLAEFTVGLFKEAELFEFYADWKIILQKSYVLEDEHPGSPKHRHPINKIVAQRIDG
ncbi:methyltransferase domain-containing protein [candidate division WOR-3 bacterium]|nr:methyltransferase domain-containing protein [candidate division WOR-3 bacterium]